MAILFQVLSDGYSAGELNLHDLTSAVPTLNQYGEQRVVLDINGVSASSSNPLPINLPSAGAPKFGQLTTSGTAQLLVSSPTVCSVGVTIYPDPNSDTYISLSAITVGTGATTFILRAGGAPLVISGPIDLHTIYALDNGTVGTLSFCGQ